MSPTATATATAKATVRRATRPRWLLAGVALAPAVEMLPGVPAVALPPAALWLVIGAPAVVAYHPVSSTHPTLPTQRIV
nr:hypothetical protein [Streptomyces specialis]